MVETDAPYLRRANFRGKRNEPSYVVEIAKVLAETRGVSLDEISQSDNGNFFRLFSKVPRAKSCGMTLTLTILGADRPPACRGLRLAGARATQHPKNRRRLLLAGRADDGTAPAGR